MKFQHRVGSPVVAEIIPNKVTTRALLLGKVPAPSAAQPFLAEIRGAKAQAVAEEKDKK
jgi:hypothetical protein